VQLAITYNKQGQKYAALPASKPGISVTHTPKRPSHTSFQKSSTGLHRAARSVDSKHRRNPERIGKPGTYVVYHANAWHSRAGCKQDGPVELIGVQAELGH
jgi:hypothetical protein